MRQEDTPTQQGGRKTRATSEWAESLEGYSQNAGSENWEPGHRRLVRRPCVKPEGLVMELWNVLQRTRARHGVARAEAWLGTWRHVDSRTSTVVQIRGVSTAEECGGRWMWGRRRWAAQERPAGYGFSWIEVQARPNVAICTPWWRERRVFVVRQITAYLSTQAHAGERL